MKKYEFKDKIITVEFTCKGDKTLYQLLKEIILSEYKTTVSRGG